MSTKDLIERLNRTAATTRRSGGTDSEGGSSQVSTRVGARVIRRRRRKDEDKALPSAAAAATEAAEDAPAAEAAEEAAAPAEEAPAAEATEKAAAKEPKEAAAKKKAPAKKKAAAKKADAAKPEATVEAEAEAETAQEAAPAEEATATDEAAATEKAPTDAAPTDEAKAEPKSTEDVAAAEVETAADTAEAAPAKEKAAAKKVLPRLGGAGAKKAFPGLGSAVVQPPPGYDPENPEASRESAREAAKQAGKKKEERTWRDQQNTTATPGRKKTEPEDGDRNRNKRGRPRNEGRRRARVEMYMDDIPSATRRRRRSRSGPKKASPQAKAIKRRVEVNGNITVVDLAHGMSIKSGQVIKSLIAMGQMATQNDTLDLETAQLIAAEFEYEIVDTTFQEDHHMIQVDVDEEEGTLEGRPPVVTIMGHVDHGKTTLLDTLRKTNVADGEAGGITQHTAAYQVEHDGKTITFIDTPGHAAFTEMRSRGAQVTDIVVLVVAADDGVMPQTIEVINHAKAAEVQIIVAVNKCDKAGVDPSQVRQALMEYELVPEEYGGDTIMVDVSALKGDGLDDLLANIALLAEVAEYKAASDRHAEGAVLEARVEKGRGPVATILVEKGTLNQGDSVVLGTVWGRVRAMSDFQGKSIKTAGPSTPVEIIGLQEVPTAGDHFTVVKDDRSARTLAEHRMEEQRIANQDGPRAVSLEELIAQAEAGETVKLNLIVKADVGGTLEAIKNSFAKIDIPGTETKILHSAVGGISESDVTLAHTYGAVIIGFNVRPDSKARHQADEYRVQLRTYSVIYEAIDDVEAALKGLLSPTIEEKVQGMAEIRETFSIPKVGTVAGVRVMEGSIARAHQVRLLRDGIIMWTGKLASLRRFKDDVREVEKGYECGMNLEGFNDIKVGDMLETFTQEEVSPI